MMSEQREILFVKKQVHRTVEAVVNVHWRFRLKSEKRSADIYLGGLYKVTDAFSGFLFL